MRTTFYHGYPVALFIVMISACAPQRFVKPLEAQQQAVNVSFGGVLFDYKGITIPMPFLTAAYAYGIDQTTTCFGALNFTAALYGNLQTELGLTKQLLAQHTLQPAVTLTPVLNIIYRNSDARKVYPQVAVNGYWEYGKHKDLVYVSLDTWLELTATAANEVKQENRMVLMPAFGHSFQRKKHCFNLEMRVVAPNLSNEGLVIDYKTPLNTHGAFAVFAGYTFKF